MGRFVPSFSGLKRGIVVIVFGINRVCLARTSMQVGKR